MAVSLPAQGEDEASPWLQIDVPMEVQFDAVVSPESAVLNDLYASVYPSVSVTLSDWLQASVGLAYEPVFDATNDRVFEDHGLYMSSAELTGTFGPLIVQAGKFSANFSLGFALTPGLNGDTFNADAEVAERVGLRGSYNLTGEGSAAGIIVSATAFRKDTSMFSNSLFSERGRLRLADGGLGNHGGLESYSVAVDVIEPTWAPGLQLQAGYLHLGKGRGDAADATGWVAAAHWMFKDDDDATYRLFGEWAQSVDALGFSDAVSSPGARQTLVTLGAEGTWAERWTAVIAFGLRDAHVPLVGASSERFLQLTLDYALDEDLSIAIGWQRYDDGVRDTDTLSLRLASGFEYALE